MHENWSPTDVAAVTKLLLLRLSAHCLCATQVVLRMGMDALDYWSHECHLDHDHYSNSVLHVRVVFVVLRVVLLVVVHEQIHVPYPDPHVVVLAVAGMSVVQDKGAYVSFWRVPNFVDLCDDNNSQYRGQQEQPEKRRPQ